MTPPRLGMFLSDILAEYPKTQIQPPYDMPLELPLEKQPTAASAPRIDLLMGDQVNMRYWLTSIDDVNVIQIQPNYLAINWRRRDTRDPYPGYVGLREHFVQTYHRIEAAVAAQGIESLEPRQAELTYVNLLQPNSLWQSHSQTDKVVSVSFADSSTYEQLSFEYTRALDWGTGGFAGRLHTAVQPAVDPSGRPVISLTLTARSTPLDPQTLNSVLDFVEIAHDAITQAFLRIITPEARAMWGLT